MKSQVWTTGYEGRRSFIGGSDARIIMGNDETALVRLWREKRGEAEPAQSRTQSRKRAAGTDRTRAST